MNIRDLKYFLAVAKYQHFGKAAEKSFVSQPTLSGQIKKLEEELGVKLFERSNRRVMLTDIGAEIAISARRILREVDAIKETAEMSLDPLSGTLRIGAFPTLASYFFPDFVIKLRRAMPNLRLVLVEEKTDILLEKLQDGTLDAAFLSPPLNDHNLQHTILFDDPFSLAVPDGHPLAQQKVIDQSELQHEKLLLLEDGHCLRDQALDVCHMHGIGEELGFRATGMETLREMVRAGSGITFIPEIAKRPSDAGITYIPFNDPVPRRYIGLYWRNTSAKKEMLQEIVGLCGS